MKYYVAICICLGIIVFKLNTMHISFINEHPTLDHHTSIYKDESCKRVQLKSMDAVVDIQYVEQAAAGCKNQYFPSIHAVTYPECNAWLHVIRHNIPSVASPLLDTWPQGRPFYTLDKNFYDHPGASYSLFHSTMSWLGHAYAVVIQNKDNKKTIKVLGGFSWGYKVPWWSIYPYMILPKSLSKHNWQYDWQTVFQKELAEYTLV